MHTVAMPRWLVSGAPRPAAPKLYCFPHGGGSAAEYLRWARGLPGAEFHAVQLPGRGSRLSEPVFTSMDTLVDGVLANVPLGRAPYAFFGHSLGSLIAYEVTRALRREDRPLPERLVVSGYPAPHLPRASQELHTLPDAELIEEVSRIHGGIPEEVLASVELRELAAVALRADYQVLETYSWRAGEPLSLPITVLGGSADHVTAEQLQAWQELTTGEVTVQQFPGGHFYLLEQPAAVLRSLAGALRTVRTKERSAPC
ncbi:alpha/beta fold hydrolase [Streptomyces lydicamycinicus]|uniref:Putative type II thioesterase n=1 Tax=Streptomyces lydicamycinicus TaxID=1546107 RepID=A0A0P4R9Q8_9ACTN|nr:alpha/beta fold hydrolase [Streptomyces lydicamycinicus]USA02820.1 alpha/beta fold hydrolase [Streptomyces lydicamycinicus]GAO09687.1 putative type II thioesterase [Streptomyces lydicamycinicus]